MPLSDRGSVVKRIVTWYIWDLKVGVRLLHTKCKLTSREDVETMDAAKVSSGCKYNYNGTYHVDLKAKIK
jgi:hypothetical protein